MENQAKCRTLSTLYKKIEGRV